MRELDIFRIDEQGPMWIEAVADMAEAEKRVRILMQSRPAEYLIFDELAGTKVMIRATDSSPSG